MRLVRLSQRNFEELETSLLNYRQLLPLYAMHSVAKKHFLEALSTKTQSCVAVEEQGHLLALISYRSSSKKVEICNLLLEVNQISKKRGFHFWIKWLEKLAKYEGKKKISMTLSIRDQLIVDKLSNEGYRQIEMRDKEGCFSKEVTYRTGLILAGGGARGAYQVGVWQALNELKINYELICGTSVGALNGGLILQGDLAVAEKMWQEIDTGKILNYPGSQSEETFSMQQAFKDVQKLATSAISSQGVNTDPLKHIINELLDEQRMHQKKQELFICTTQLPQMREVVVSLSETPKGQFHHWLLASSSFFPAMEAAKIQGSYYVDGGYRNNVPVDVALAHGATELIVVDVKGPGITKPVRISPDIPVREISSPWNLGTVLLFNGARSSFNLKLGYLETMKNYGKYSGYWYTFSHQLSDQELLNWGQAVATVIEEECVTSAGRKLIKRKIKKELLPKTRRLYNEWVSEETMYLYLLELVAKVLGIKPTRLYTIPSLIEKVKEKLKSDTWQQDESEVMLLSVNEWLKRYVEDLPLPTEKQQVRYLYTQLKLGKEQVNISKLTGNALTMYLTARMMQELASTKQKLEGE